MATRRYGTIVRHLRDDPDTASELAAKLPDAALIELGAAIRDEVMRRARPGGLVARSRANHRCQFVSVDETWVWENRDLIREDKRSLPGSDEGFRAIALLPIIEGMTLDVVRARMRQGQHAVERVVSMAVRRGRLVEIATRDVSARGAR